MTLDALKKNLRDVGNIGSLLIDNETRDAIQRLKERAFKEAELDKKILNELHVGGSYKTIPSEKVKEIHATDDFQRVLRRLQMISYASFHDIESWQKDSYYIGPDGFLRGGIATYLFVDMLGVLPDSLGMYLVSSVPDPVGDFWPGNPIGNVFRTFIPLSKIQLKNWLSNDLIIDDFYQSLSATVPIFDKNNKTIAFLGLDYSVGPELGKLSRLKQICFILIIISLLLSFIFSYIISKSLNAPLEELCNAAIKVSNNDYTATVNIETNDEFGLLGKVFNTMLGNIKNAVNDLDIMNRNLESLVLERTLELQEANEKLNAKNRELAILSNTDMLTGVYNRRYLEKQIQTAVSSS